jgi:hypothetical protein
METVLNLEWMTLAALMCWLWMRYARREGHERSAQFVSLALVLAIMFTVITMYDDIAMAQNPAEAVCFQRKAQDTADAHHGLHPVASTMLPHSSESSSDSSCLAVLGNPFALAVKVPALNSIRNRPPPAA